MPYPKGLPRRYRRYWNKPWLRRAAWSPGFRRALARRGFLTPHFRIEEARCKDGTPVPSHLMKRCRGHAFHLERVRHATGDRPIPVISWYRHPSYNVAVGGATFSQHIFAVATDHPASWVSARGGQSHLIEVGRRAGMKGVGFYPAGSMHFDSRSGAFATWRSY